MHKFHVSQQQSKQCDYKTPLKHVRRLNCFEFYTGMRSER